MRDLEQRKVRLVEVETQTPSPFARSLLFGYVAQFLYEGDSPLAERRAAALALDPTLLAELLGRGEGAALRDLLDPAALARTEAELQRLAPTRRVRGLEGVADLLRLLGPLTAAEVAARAVDPAAPTRAAVGGGTEAGEDAEPPAIGEEVAAGWLTALEQARRGDQGAWPASRGGPRGGRRPLQDALGTPLPVGVAEAFTEPVPTRSATCSPGTPARTGPFTAADVAGRFGLGTAVVVEALRRLTGAGRLVEGELRPLESGGGQGTDCATPRVLRTVRRRSLAALRAEVEPVPARDLAAFLPGWQGVGSPVRGAEGVLRAVEQLAGALVPASALETLVLPARVPGYSPALLDELTAAGEVVWSAHGSLPGDDGWVSLHPTDLAPLTLADPMPSGRTGRCTGRSWRRWPAVVRTSSARCPTPSGRPTTRPWRRCCGTSPGPACSPTTRWPRCGRACPAAGRRTGPGDRPEVRHGSGRYPSLRAGMSGAAARRPGCRAARGRPPRPDGGRCSRRASPTRPCATTPPPRSCSSGTACSLAAR
jgi:ATP-dependent Lhr-like helicase